MVTRALLLATLLATPAAVFAQTTAPPLALETKIPLPAVSGRIDHLDIDLKRQRLFVAELGNDSLGIVDLTRRTAVRVDGFSEPQGVGYEPTTDTVYVANGGDGSVRLLRGADFAALGRIELGEDADNLRVDASRRRVLVGHGDSGLAIIDVARRAKLSDIRLPGHPESFQLGEDGRTAFINVPDAHRIAIADLTTEAVHRVPTGSLRSNFPMAIDAAAHRLLVGFWDPPTLAAFAPPDARLVARAPICSDADDLWVDAKRHRIYISCGAGFVDVLQPAGDGYARIARVPTASGARTSLFVPELDRLYVAARAGWTEPAAIWVFRPTP
jgi:hypothetical protein